MSDHERHAEVTGVTCKRTQDGTLQSAKTQVEYFEYYVDEDGESYDHQKGESIRFRYEHEGSGHMVLAGWKDASDHSGWVSPQVFRCLPASTAAVGDIPDVESVEDVHDCLTDEVDIGIKAYHTGQERR